MSDQSKPTKEVITIVDIDHMYTEGRNLATNIIVRELVRILPPDYMALLLPEIRSVRGIVEKRSSTMSDEDFESFLSGYENFIEHTIGILDGGRTR